MDDLTNVVVALRSIDDKLDDISRKLEWEIERDDKSRFTAGIAGQLDQVSEQFDRVWWKLDEMGSRLEEISKISEALDQIREALHRGMIALDQELSKPRSGGSLIGLLTAGGLIAVLATLRGWF